MDGEVARNSHGAPLFVACRTTGRPATVTGQVAGQQMHFRTLRQSERQLGHHNFRTLLDDAERRVFQAPRL